MSAQDFSSLHLDPALERNLTALGYSEMTPIQAQSLPTIVAGQDVVAQGKTGSGKTAAFGLGILHHLQVKQFHIQALVLCPTRELAEQVANEIRRLARAVHNIKILTLCGGTPLGPQIGSLAHGAHIIVGTPGRIEEHLRKGTLTLDRVKRLVLDEADRMLDMGFQPAIDAIVEQLPSARQTLLFSATYPDQIQQMADRLSKQAKHIKVVATHDHSSIQQHFFRLGQEQSRSDGVVRLLRTHQSTSAVVFCNTKRETQTLANDLNQAGISALALHGDLEQKQRNQALVCFANQSTSVLVATDVAARGLDVEQVDTVINYQLSRESEVHIHRIGRTGRAGRKGLALSLVGDKDLYALERLQQYVDTIFELEDLPSLGENEATTQPPMVTLQIDGGKKQKVRPGDILGALTGENGIKGSQVGKINVTDFCAYVAVDRAVGGFALKKLTQGKLKGRSFRVRRLKL